MHSGVHGRFLHFHLLHWCTISAMHEVIESFVIERNFLPSWSGTTKFFSLKITLFCSSLICSSHRVTFVDAPSSVSTISSLSSPCWLFLFLPVLTLYASVILFTFTSTDTCLLVSTNWSLCSMTGDAVLSLNSTLDTSRCLVTHQWACLLLIEPPFCCHVLLPCMILQSLNLIGCCLDMKSCIGFCLFVFNPTKWIFEALSDSVPSK